MRTSELSAVETGKRKFTTEEIDNLITTYDLNNLVQCKLYDSIR